MKEYRGTSVTAPHPREAHRYEIRSEVKVSAAGGGVVTVIHPDTGLSATYRQANFEWNHLGPVPKVGIYQDADGVFWRWTGEAWEKEGRLTLNTKPIGPITRLVSEETIHV